MADIIDPVYQTRTEVVTVDHTDENTRVVSKELGKIVDMLAIYSDDDIAKVASAIAQTIGQMKLLTKQQKNKASEQAA